MANLFVDCDDTLALYCATPDSPACEHGGIHPYGGRWSPWVANAQLVEGIKLFRAAYPNALIVVWSGGGKEYAQTFVDLLLPDLDIVAMNKWHPFTNIVRDGDIVVDDQWEHMGLNLRTLKVVGPVDDRWIKEIK